MSIEFLEAKRQIRVHCDATGCKKTRSRGMPPTWGAVIVYVPSDTSAKSLTLHACSTKCIERMFADLAQSVNKFKQACAKKSKAKKVVY